MLWRVWTGLTAAALTLFGLTAAVWQRAPLEPIEVGSDRQLFLDDFWFETRQNVELTVHLPELKEVVIAPEHPWERTLIHYSTVVFEQGMYRMWYRATDGNPWDVGPDGAGVTWTCYAQSRDGIHWEKPSLGLFSYGGSTENNIVGDAVDFFNISVIVDPNEKPGSDRRYKMISRVRGISGFVSRDGFRWSPVRSEPLLTEGPFDSHNILLWDDERKRYVIYMRGVDTSVGGSFKSGRRAVRRSESADFINWSRPEMVFAPDGEDPVDLHFYTNAATKYYRAARAFFMFPMTLYPERTYSEAPFPGLSDIQFAFSRDGVHWQRPFRKPYIRPGLDERNWVDRNPIVGQGIVPTGPGEISFYYSEFFRSPQTRMRRAALRTDGFVSVDGPYNGWGEFVTKPIRFKGNRLELNYSTGGGGLIQVELQDGAGKPVPGRRLEDCPGLVGDRIAGIVEWKEGEKLAELEGKPVRLKVRLRDAHLYAFRFTN